MENSFQTSFIPKKPITSGNLGSGGKSVVSLFSVFTVIILIIVGALAGGLFLYKDSLAKQKLDFSASIAKAHDNFNIDTINELELFSNRYSSSKTVLKDHIVLSPLFKLISDITVPAVQYTKFDHQTTEAGFVVKMSGIARDYRSVALQADVFTAKAPQFQNVIFSNLTKDRTNYVLFNVEFTVAKSLLMYDQSSALDSAILPSQAPTTQGTQQKIKPQIQTQGIQPVTTPVDATNTNTTASVIPNGTDTGAGAVVAPIINTNNKPQ